jgi:RNA polymerase sigma factor (sigma-70 family)
MAGAPDLTLRHACTSTGHGPPPQPITNGSPVADVSRAPFEQIVERHGATVLRVCRAVVGPDVAEDAWSETFLAALQAYPRLPADANVEAWLVTIAHRKALDQIRARRRRALPSGDLPERVAASADGLDPDLVSEIAALPDKQRQAVAYHYVAGLPYDAVAEILGGTAEAARRAAADGIKALRRTFPTHARTHR